MDDKNKKIELLETLQSRLDKYYTILDSKYRHHNSGFENVDLKPLEDDIEKSIQQAVDLYIIQDTKEARAQLMEAGKKYEIEEKYIKSIK